MFFKKKKEQPCCCGGFCSSNESASDQKINVKKTGILVLGSGCAKCNELELNTKEALKELGVNQEIVHISDYAEMAAYGVMSTPALVIDGAVASVGRTLSKKEVIDLIKKHRA